MKALASPETRESAATDIRTPEETSARCVNLGRPLVGIRFGKPFILFISFLSFLDYPKEITTLCCIFIVAYLRSVVTVIAFLSLLAVRPLPLTFLLASSAARRFI
jgi:hypothetical protein